MPGGGSLHPPRPKLSQRKCTTSTRKGRRYLSTPCGAWRNSPAEMLERNGFTSRDLALVVPHQANLRIIRAMQERLALTIRR